MKSHEQKFAEAIEALTYRLTQWAVADPETKAREFIRDLTHHGWRGAVAELDLPPARTEPTADVTTAANAARIAGGFAPKTEGSA